MDVAAADAFAKKKLRQVPRLNKKVQDARVIQDYKGKSVRVDAELAAAQARLAQLQQAAAAPAGQFTVATIGEQPPKSTLLQTASSSKGPPADSQQACQQQLKQVRQHPGASPASQTTANAATAASTNIKSHALPPPVIPASAADLAAAASAAVNPPLIFPARASVGPLGTASIPAGCTSSTQQHTSGKHSSRSTSSSNGGSSAACSYRSSRSHSSSCSQEQQQKQQQLAAADGILAQINEYMAAEVSQADAAVQNLLLLQQQQQQETTAARASSTDPQPKDSSTAAAAINGKCASQPGAMAIGVAADAAAKAAALQAFGIDSNSYTPELLASLAMRFQAYNLPPGLNSTLDLGTIALAVQQQEKEAAQQRQQQEWLLQQQRQQLARQSAANRHLQLYQLGVVQQRARLQQGSGLVGPACITAASYKAPGQAMLRQQQQQQQACGSSASAEQQQQQQQQLVAEAGQDGPDRRMPFSSAGQDVSDAAEGGAAQIAATEPAVLTISVAAVTHMSATAATDAASPATDPLCGTIVPGSSEQQPAGCAVLPTSQQHSEQPHACNSNQLPHTPDKIRCCQAPVAASNSKAVSSTASTALLLQQPAASRPLQRRYKSDVPGAPGGASHGHLSPAGLTFNHLPGSRRQVYARIQDALACSDAISEAEQSLRALTYAPCSRPAAAGSL